ncbi:MAG: hypothetical protein AAFY11_16275 [Cyanobacteria bacterium J06641_5]
MASQTRRLWSLGAAIAMTFGVVAAPLPERDRVSAQAPEEIPVPPQFDAPERMDLERLAAFNV